MDIENTRREAWRLFDRIATRYDFLNRLLSLRQDVVWRKKLAKYLPSAGRLALLDVATGTADQIIFLLKEAPSIERAVGIDLSENMLAVGKKKIDDLRLSEKVILRHGDGVSLPFDNNTFDVTTISFGIRNIPNYPKALKEMNRVLKPGGRALVLEFSLPEKYFIKAPYLFYFRNVLPKIGGRISGDAKAYRYLNSTVEEFPYGDDFLEKMRAAGFEGVERYPLTLGIATIYLGYKVKDGAGNGL